MTASMRDCDTVIHAAAHVEEHGPLAEFMRINVDGTRRAMAAARAAGVSRFVLISTEAVLADGKPIIRADEERPYPAGAAGPYALTKRLQEIEVIAANAPGFATVAVRPRFIWGARDTSVLPGLVDLVNRGRFAWIGGGRFLTSTCHVDNVVEGALLAAERGTGIYFLTDGEPVELREFITKLLATQGVDAGAKTVPRWIARALARTTAWMKHPPVSRLAVALVGGEVTVDDHKARRDLGYSSAMTRERGLAEMTP
jgi:nucleoside-diphosphate-sugar epimerase